MKSLELIVSGAKVYRRAYVRTLGNAMQEGVPFAYAQVCWNMHKAIFDADRRTPSSTQTGWDIMTRSGSLRYVVHMVREAKYCSENTLEDIQGYGGKR